MNPAYEKARQTWENMSAMRERRSRFLRFTYGRQWDDAIRDPDTGRIVTERQLLSKDGRPPLTNNLIRQLVKSIVGKYRATCATSDNIRYPEYTDIPMLSQRDLVELDSRLLEEFLISGIAVQRIGTDSYSRSKGLAAVENISPARFIIGATSDPLGKDVTLTGAVHAMTPEQIVMRWGGGKRQSAMSLLAQLQQSEVPQPGVWSEAMPFGAVPNGRVAVVEVWTLEAFESYCVHDSETATVRNASVKETEALRAENRRRSRNGRRPLAWRWQLSRRWVGRWFLSDGVLLDTVKLPEGSTQPFLFKLYPLIDGEVHSLVEDVVDQQKYVNRLINLLDRMMATAAKGALLFPVDALPEGCEFTDIARQWSATDGVVLYKALPGDAPPQQLTTTVGDVGAKDLLKVEMELFKEISGVGDTLAGRSVPSTVGADRYALELENASVSVRDLLDTFASLIIRRNSLIANCNAEDK